MRKALFPFLLLGFLNIFFSCKNEQKEVKKITKAIPHFKKEGQLTLSKSNGTTLKTLNIEIADDDYQRQTGLMYRTTMKPLEGMLFIFPNQAPRSFYMKNTLLALDIIYIDSSKKVVSIQKNATPLNETSLPSEGPAQYVLEINAGLSEAWKLEKGDFVNWELTN